MDQTLFLCIDNFGALSKMSGVYAHDDVDEIEKSGGIRSVWVLYFLSAISVSLPLTEKNTINSHRISSTTNFCTIWIQYCVPPILVRLCRSYIPSSIVPTGSRFLCWWQRRENSEWRRGIYRRRTWEVPKVQLGGFRPYFSIPFLHWGKYRLYAHCRKLNSWKSPSASSWKNAINPRFVYFSRVLLICLTYVFTRVSSWFTICAHSVVSLTHFWMPSKKMSERWIAWRFLSFPLHYL